MDFALVGLNFAIGYKLLAAKYAVFNAYIKKILVALQTLLAMQAMFSLCILLAVLNQSKGLTQTFTRFILGPCLDWLTLSVVLILAFQFFFQLKRVEIQMNEKYRSMAQTLAALKKQKWIEKVVLRFYLFSVFFFVVSIISIIVSILTGTVEAIESPKDYRRLVYVFMMVYYAILLVADILTVLYFMKMGKNYLDILSEVYTIRTVLFKSTTMAVTLWVVFTLARFDIFVNLIQIISIATGDEELRYETLYGAPNVVMIYFTKITPFLLVAYVQNLVAFFGREKGQAAQDDGGVEVANELQNSLHPDTEIASIKGSVRIEDCGDPQEEMKVNSGSNFKPAGHSVSTKYMISQRILDEEQAPTVQFGSQVSSAQIDSEQHQHIRHARTTSMNVQGFSQQRLRIIQDAHKIRNQSFNDDNVERKNLRNAKMTKLMLESEIIDFN